MRRADLHQAHRQRQVGTDSEQQYRIQLDMQVCAREGVWELYVWVSLTSRVLLQSAKKALQYCALRAMSSLLQGVCFDERLLAWAAQQQTLADTRHQQVDMAVLASG